MSRSGFDWSSWGSISRNRQDERDISSTSLAFCSRACNHRCQLRRPRDSFLSYPRSELARFAYKKRKGFVLWGIPPSPSTLVWKSDKAHVWPVFRFRRGRRNVVVAISFERRWKMENPLFRMLILWKIRAPPPPPLSLFVKATRKLKSPRNLRMPRFISLRSSLRRRKTKCLADVKFGIFISSNEQLIYRCIVG